jgi:hypothetical protein
VFGVHFSAASDIGLGIPRFHRQKGVVIDFSPQFIEFGSFHKFARPELVEGLSFSVRKLQKGKTILRQAQGERGWAEMS